jgi:hypothetical protein
VFGSHGAGAGHLLTNTTLFASRRALFKNGRITKIRFWGVYNDYVNPLSKKSV